MSTITLEAQTRIDKGKGASRRLRRLENNVPGVIYGGHKEPQTIHVSHHKLAKALENEAIYSSVFNVYLDGQAQQVIIKDLQRHPYKPLIMHIDLQRVSGLDLLVRAVPLHFINEATAKGVKAGGMINHLITQVEIRCQADQLPEFISIDMGNVELNQSVHLSDLILPAGTELTVDTRINEYNLSIASIHRHQNIDTDDELAADNTAVDPKSE